MSGFLQSRNVRFPISTSHGLVSAEQAVAARHGVPERALQRFLGHASVLSTRRYARLADHALVEVLRPAKADWRQPGDKPSATKLERDQQLDGGPAWIRTRDRPVMSRLL